MKITIPPKDCFAPRTECAMASSSVCSKRNRSRKHDKNNTTNDHTKNHPPHFTDGSYTKG